MIEKQLFTERKLRAVNVQLSEDLSLIEEVLKHLLRQLIGHRSDIKNDTNVKSSGKRSLYSGRSSVSTNLSGMSDQTIDFETTNDGGMSISIDKWVDHRSKISLIPLE